MERVHLLRELAERLRNLANLTNEKAESMAHDAIEHAWLCGTSRGYMMAYRLLRVHAGDLEGELMHHIVMQSRELDPAHR